MKNSFPFLTTSLPLHLAQEELLNRQPGQAGSPDQAVGGCLVITGSLNYALVRRVVDHLPVMFDVFRWQFDPAEAVPRVSVADQFRRPILPLLDCSENPNPRQAADAWAINWFVKPFDLADRRFFDLALLRVSDYEHRLLVRGHRLLLDDTGFDRLVRYITEAYSAMQADEPMPSQAPSYADEVESARVYLNSLAYSEDHVYWQKQFSDLPSPLLNEQATGQFLTRQLYRIPADESLGRTLNLAVASTGAAPTDLLLAALTIYFSRASQQSVCVFGRVVAGRQSKRQRSTLGRFDCLLPIQIKYDPDQTLPMLLRTIKRQSRADGSHRFYPMSHLIQRLSDTDRPQARLFDVLVKHIPPVPVLPIEGLECRVERFASAEGDLPLQLLWRDNEAQRSASLQLIGNPAYLSMRDARNLSYCIEHLLLDFAHRPEAAVGTFESTAPSARTRSATAYTRCHPSSQIGRLAMF
ncbi:condensation domain-containing protein [Spirosoma sp. 209]|uniref:condensation domain-containing protein n=1 Tax=Spirosoma sp. 209 TaxID=1955701 RepID=UPI00098D00DC|nr:condensation domain-containing protein [Spirosoma sp. 209]